MPKSVLSRGRKWTARFAVLAMVASLMAIAVPAGAQVQDTSDSCPDSIPSAGFTDLGGLDATTVQAIDCLVAYGISLGTSATTFSPTLSVPRWQMALFLTRQAAVHGVTLPDGSPQGFTDIGGLSADAQTAINQLKQLGITQGTSATTFSPFDVVSRWQMALFLTRLVDAAGVTLPDGSDQGYADISGQSAAAQTAINQVTQLGIAQGTSATTFVPTGATLRWQMALFLTRTLAADGIRPAGTSVTGGPELIRVFRSDSDADDSEVAFQFDETVAALLTDTDVLLIDFAGNLQVSPGGGGTVAVAKSGDNDDIVAGIWDNDVFDYAVGGTVLSEAVDDLSDNLNPAATKGLQSVTVNRADYDPALASDLPELISIGDFDPDTDEVTFTFDQDIDDASGDFTKFHLIRGDGTLETATAGALDADITGDEVTVEFNGLSQSQFNDVVRAYVEADAVNDEDNAGDPNPPMAIDVSGGGDVDTGDGPNIDSVDLSDADDGEVTFTFDRDIEDTAPDDPVAANFFITHYDPGTETWVTTTGSSIEDVDGKDVTVGFGGLTAQPDIVIYATVFLDGVVDEASGNGNLPDTHWISHTFASGETAGPDLVSVEVSPNLAGSQITVTWTFDEDVDGPPAGLKAWDDDGDEVDITGGTVDDDDDDEIIELVFTTGDAGFDELDDQDIFSIGYDTAPVDLVGYSGAPYSMAPDYN